MGNTFSGCQGYFLDAAQIKPSHPLKIFVYELRYNLGVKFKSTLEVFRQESRHRRDGKKISSAFRTNP
jgi:hypothetical protein